MVLRKAIGDLKFPICESKLQPGDKRIYTSIIFTSPLLMSLIRNEVYIVVY
jgi:hypothetical protein